MPQYHCTVVDWTCHSITVQLWIGHTTVSMYSCGFDMRQYQCTVVDCTCHSINVQLWIGHATVSMYSCGLCMPQYQCTVVDLTCHSINVQLWIGHATVSMYSCGFGHATVSTGLHEFTLKLSLRIISSNLLSKNLFEILKFTFKSILLICLILRGNNCC